MKKTRNQKATETAIDRWMASYHEIGDLLAEIQAAHDAYYEADPDAINWGHVGDLDATRKTLTDLRDRIKGLGEYAPNAIKTYPVVRADGRVVNVTIPENER